MRQDARAFARALERAHDVQQVGVIALFGGRRAERLEPFIRIVERVEPRAPTLV